MVSQYVGDRTCRGVARLRRLQVYAQHDASVLVPNEGVVPRRAGYAHRKDNVQPAHRAKQAQQLLMVRCEQHSGNGISVLRGGSRVTSIAAGASFGFC